MQKASELGLQSLAICVINSVKRNYPPDEGAHLALRKKMLLIEICFKLSFFSTGTVRRFLERHNTSLDTIIFALENTDRAIYDVLMPLYFPRSEAEENAARWQLPADVGGCYGEPVMPDREIRIIDNPQHSFHRKFYTKYYLSIIQLYKKLQLNICVCNEHVVFNLLGEILHL